MKHLIMSLGETGHLVAEVIGYFNYDQYPLYLKHQNLNKFLASARRDDLQGIDQLTMICTQRSYNKCKDQVVQFVETHQLKLKLQFHYIELMEDIVSETDALVMKNLFYKLIYLANISDKQQDLILCLSGGRKTMSSDMQEAAYLFGCKAMVHILADGYVDFDLLADPAQIPAEIINRINPVIYSKDIRATHVLEQVKHRYAQGIEFNQDLLTIVHKPGNMEFLDLVEEVKKQQNNLAQNFGEQLSFRETSSHFHALMLLPKKTLTQLKQSKIEETDLDWLYALPKTDLHCHLGGIADSAGLIRIAHANLIHTKADSLSKSIILKVREAIKNCDIRYLETTATCLLKQDRAIRWLGLSTFLCCFENYEQILDHLVYGKYLDPSAFCGIGLESYERIGDYQGSSLLQSEHALRAAAKLLKEDAERNNLLYKEVRCSPANYTNTLSPKDVVMVLWDELKDHTCLFRLIIIGSRHRSPDVLRMHADLCLEIKKNGGDLADFICGFDLAGPEGLVEPEALREVIRPLLEECIRITIHAGETSSVKDIWKAVYQLNADRIGHGLSLAEDHNLLVKLRDHKTAVELCPSSNYQISGFRCFDDPRTVGFKEYPLREYLAQGVKACICTDDPGISRTDISREYLMASKLCKEGLSKWDVLVLIRNGFVNAFLPFTQKQKLIRKAEERILNLVQSLR